MPLKRAMFWKVRAMPSLVRADGETFVTSAPSNWMFPRWGR